MNYLLSPGQNQQRINRMVALENDVKLLREELRSGIASFAKGYKGECGERGENGEHGDRGERGEKGEPGLNGDVLVPNEAELADAVISLRAKLSRWIAAVALAKERNAQRKTEALRSVVNSVLVKITNDVEG